MSIEALPQPAPAALALAPALPAAGGLAALDEWVGALDKANKIANFMAASNFVPQSLRQKGKGQFKNRDELALDCTAIILAGASIGYDPFQAVQQMFIVHGSPAMYARSMVALVQSKGHKVKQLRASADSVTVGGKYRGEDEWEEFTWDYARAERAGYTSNPKYRTNPQEMLYAKAAAECCRRMFADVLAGVSPYSVEEQELEPFEVIDGDTLQPMEPQPTTKKARSFQRAATSAAASVPLTVVKAPEEPATVDEPAPAPAPAPEPAEPAEAGEPVTELCNTHQQVEIAHQLDRAGVRTKAAKLARVQEWAGRELTSVTGLTADEADRLINELMFANDNPEAPTEALAPEQTTIDPQAVDAAWGITNEGQN